MQVLFAVIDDLWKFARTALFGVFFEPANTYNPDVYETVVQRDSHQLALLPLSQTQVPLQSDPDTAQNAQTTSILLHQEQFFIGEALVCVYIDPVVAFDTVCMTLSYGTIVYVQKWGGRWACIALPQGTSGWVLKDSLREQAADVFPSLREGEHYDAQSTQAQRIRLCIGDCFNADAIALPITDVEFVTYLLWKKRKSITWDLQRPRIAGTWQKKLRGAPGIHIGIYPRTDSIMEYQIDEVGHIAYVEAVFPDETIKIVAMGMYDEGVYAEASLPKEQWKELRPVFIEVA